MLDKMYNDWLEYQEQYHLNYEALWQKWIRL